jgi:hypothetical protein
MTKKIKCQTKEELKSEEVRVRIIKAPLVSQAELRSVLLSRAKALVV